MANPQALRIGTWNVNSIRARLPRVLPWLAERGPDVIALQETKCQDTQFPFEDLRAAGYHALVAGQKTYNGVAILSREPAREIARALPTDEGEGDGQARFLDAEVAGLRLLCCYVPNGQEVGAPAFAYKLRWLARLRAHLDAQCDPSTPLAVVGDFNVAPEAIDVHDPVAFAGRVLFTVEERAALARVVEWGLVDSVRAMHPGESIFSWWDYRQLGFPKGHGLRIDHVLMTQALFARCAAAGVDRDARKGKQPSDHAPVLVDLDR